jgi:hypothetical protein
MSPQVAELPSVSCLADPATSFCTGSPIKKFSGPLCVAVTGGQGQCGTVSPQCAAQAAAH